MSGKRVLAKWSCSREPARGLWWTGTFPDCREQARGYKETRSRGQRSAGFTLAEVLAALLLLAIVVPAAIEGLHVASTAGTVAARKAEAARVAEQILNENVIMVNGNQANQSGIVMANGAEYHWSLRNEQWPADAMQLLTAEVTFVAQERPCLVRLSTLVNAQ